MLLPNEIKLVVGLGNPGFKYENTRHNVGFSVIDAIAGDLSFIEKNGGKYGEIRLAGKNIILLKPQKYMNRSGGPLLAAMKENGFKTNNMIVVYDDIDLPLGRIRFRPSGSSGGHRGIESIIETIGTSSFIRLRIGIGPAREEDLADFVLQPFTEDEKEQMEIIKKISVDGIRDLIKKGLACAASTYNGLTIAMEKGDNP